MPKVETWKAIARWEGLYEVSDHGRVRSLDRTVKGRSGPTRYKGRILKPGFGALYALVTLAETGVGRREQHYVHDLVLKTFVGPKPEGMEVCHGREGQLVNTPENLRYDTRSANAQDRLLFGKPHPKRGRNPPAIRQCFVCLQMFETYRRTSLDVRRICPNAECTAEFSRFCVSSRMKRPHVFPRLGVQHA